MHWVRFGGLTQGREKFVTSILHVSVLRDYSSGMARGCLFPSFPTAGELLRQPVHPVPGGFPNFHVRESTCQCEPAPEA